MQFDTVPSLIQQWQNRLALPTVYYFRKLKIHQVPTNTAAVDAFLSSKHSFSLTLFAIFLQSYLNVTIVV